MLNTETNEWFPKRPSAPAPLYCMKTAVVGEKGYFMGGADKSGCEPTMTVYEINIQTMIDNLHKSSSKPIWKEISGLELIGAAPLSINGSLLAVGGSDDKAVTTTAIYEYQPDSSDDKKWRKVGDLPRARHFCTCVMIMNSEMIVAGGELNRREQLKCVDVAQIAWN